MQFEPRLRQGLVDRSIDVCFRRWRRPQVVAGNRYRSMVGMVRVDEVDVVRDPATITVEDARRAGYDSLEALTSDLRPPSADTVLYRLVLRLLDEPDARDELARATLDEEARAGLVARLARLDRAAADGPWTMDVLRTIESRPGVRAADLAASSGRETLPFKRDVRKLKELGLTFSLEVGYRLSPRGEAFLRGCGAP